MVPIPAAEHVVNRLMVSFRLTDPMHVVRRSSVSCYET